METIQPLAIPQRTPLQHAILILDASLCSVLPATQSIQLSIDFTEALMKAMCMKKLGPFAVYPALDDDYPGFSFIQPITTSHISGHYFEEKDGISHIHLDVYSCKTFDWQQVISIGDRFFSFTHWVASFVTRDRETPRQYQEITGNGMHISNIRSFGESEPIPSLVEKVLVKR